MPGVFRSSINLARWRGGVPNALNAGRVESFFGAAALADVQAGLAREATVNAGFLAAATQAYLQAVYNALSGQSTAIYNETAKQATLVPTQGTVNAIYALLTGAGASLTSAVRRTHHGDLAINSGSLSGMSTLPWAVDLSKALVFGGGSGAIVSSGGSVVGIGSAFAIRFASATQVIGYRQGTSGDGSIYYSVMEFW